MAWYWKLERAVYAVYPFILVIALVLVGAFFLNFTTESSSIPVWHDNVMSLHPNQTIIHNVTISYEVHGPTRGYGTRTENGSLVVEEPPLSNSLTSWSRAWIDFMIELNQSGDSAAVINRSLVGPDGIIETWAEMGLAAGGGIGVGTPEVTQGGTYRLSLQNMGSQDIQLRLTWNLNWHDYEKPYFNYGVAGLLVALVYPAMFLIQKIGPWMTRQRADS